MADIFYVNSKWTGRECDLLDFVVARRSLMSRSHALRQLVLEECRRLNIQAPALLQASDSREGHPPKRRTRVRAIP